VSAWIDQTNILPKVIGSELVGSLNRPDGRFEDGSFTSWEAEEPIAKYPPAIRLAFLAISAITCWFLLIGGLVFVFRTVAGIIAYLR